MKKITSVVMILCLLLGNLTYIFAEKAKSTVEYAEVVPGGVNTNIDLFSSWNGTVEEKAGKQALLRTNDKDSNRYIIVAVSNDFIYAPDGQPTVISVEYYDEGEGSFTITYDGTNNKQYTGASQTNGEIVQLTDTKEWKTHKFYIPDCKFVKGYWLNSDFRIGLWSNDMGHSKGNVYFGKIRIEKTEAREPLETNVVSGCYGNILGKNEKNMTIALKNISSENVNAKVHYDIFNEAGIKIFERDFVKDISSKQSGTEAVDMTSVKDFGLYTIDVSVDYEYNRGGENKKGSSKSSFEFSLVNKPEKPNSRWHASTHASWYDFNATAAIAKYAGFAGVRDEIEWEYVEQTKGQFSVPDKYDNYVRRVNQNNMDYLLILDFGNQYYDNEPVYHRGYAPYTDEGIAAYARYCAYMAEKYKGVINTFEIWNEYNLVGFNLRQEDGATYAKMLKAAYTAIKEVNPDATVVGMVTAGIAENFMRQVLENGGYNYMDALSYHWYDWSGKLRLDLFIKEGKKVQILLNEYGGQKPIWITENGATSSLGKTGVGEYMQAVNAVQMYATAMGEHLCDRIYWYDLQNDGNDLNEQEHCLGLVRSSFAKVTPYAAKQAFVTVAGMNSLLNDATPYEKETVGQTTIYKFKKENGDKICVAWSSKESEKVQIDFGNKNINIYDMYTNRTESRHSATGIHEITTGISPIYIEMSENFDVKLSIDNVVTENANTSLGISVSNKGKHAVNAELKWQIFDSAGAVKASGVKDLAANVNQKLIFGIDAGILKSGTYRAELILEGEDIYEYEEYDFTVS